jgi:hypothetical protein
LTPAAANVTAAWQLPSTFPGARLYSFLSLALQSLLISFSLCFLPSVTFSVPPVSLLVSGASASCHFCTLLLSGRLNCPFTATAAATATTATTATMVIVVVVVAALPLPVY